MKPEYLAWINEKYPDRGSSHHMSREATKHMASAFPELRRMKGYALVQGEVRPRKYWWCETPDGLIIDPVINQWPDGIAFYDQLTSEERPHGVCHKCGQPLFASGGHGSILCRLCLDTQKTNL